jgi:ligand-binding sensor domain-containing protein
VGDENTYTTRAGGRSLELVAAPHALPYRTSAVGWVGSDLYAGTTEGHVLRSVDGGKTWDSAGTPADGAAIRAFAGDGDRVFVGTDGGVFTRRTGLRASVSWRQESAPAGPVAALAQRDGVIYAAIRSAVYRSHDSGLTWQVTGGAPAPADILSLAVDRDTLYCGTTEGFYRMAFPTTQQVPPSFRVLSRPIASASDSAPWRHARGDHGGPGRTHRPLAVAS